MTKSFTALAILTLRDEGRLRSTSRRGNTFPSSRDAAADARCAGITIRHLLTHSAGSRKTTHGAIASSRSRPNAHVVGPRGPSLLNLARHRLRVPNYGFALLGQIVARASGMPYRDFVSTRILRPLGCRPPSLGLRPMCPPAARPRYRWNGGVVGGGDAACRWLLRRDGRTADLGPRPRAIHRVHALGVAATGRRGQGAGEAQLRAGDAAGAAVFEPDGEAPVRVRTDDRLDARLRVWPCLDLGLFLPLRCLAWRWPAGLRVEHDVAARVRRWRLRDGERDLRRPRRSRARGAGSAQRDRRACSRGACTRRQRCSASATASSRS